MEKDMSNTNILLKTNLSKRIYGLDILRAVAIMTVLVGHTIHYAPHVFKIIYSYIYIDGVTLFFVLSGFLIGDILIKLFNVKEINPKTILTFWMNRWLRTLPPYFFVLIILMILAHIFNIGFKINGFQENAKFFFFLQNFNWAQSNFFLESWSLAVEEWFYLSTPLIYIILHVFLRFNIKNSFILTILFIIILPTVFRYYKYTTATFTDIHMLIQSYTEYIDLYFRKQVLTRLDSIMYGVLGAFISYYYNSIWVKSKYVCFLLAILIYITELFIYPPVLSYSMISIMYLLTLPLLSNIRKGSGILYKIITYISLISYSLYLLHFSLIEFSIMPFFSNLDLHKIIKWSIFWFLTFGLSTLMYLYIEKPFMDLRYKIKFLKK